MKHIIMLTIVSTLFFFGCEANNPGDNSNTAGGPSNEDGAVDDANNEDNDPKFAGLCLGVDTSSETVTLDDGADYRIIRDQAGLKAITDDLAAHYILCSDIHLNAPFTPINPDEGDIEGNDVEEDIEGNDVERDGFIGILEGNDRTISNLKIQAESSNYVGLFGQIGEDGVVRNFRLILAADGNTTTPSILGARYVGALVGKNKGAITNVGVADGHVQANISDVGGLVGYNSGTITQSYAIGGVEGKEYIGGLVGKNEGGTIAISHASSSVEGKEYIGGLVGKNEGGTITRSKTTGSAKGMSSIGGLVGYNEGGTIENSYARNSVVGTGSHLGGLVGDNSGQITKSYATGRVTGGDSDVGGLVGYNSKGTITASYFDATTTGQPQLENSQGIADYTQGTAFYTHSNGKVYTEAPNGNGDLINEDDHFPEWDFDTIWYPRGEGRWPQSR